MKIVNSILTNNPCYKEGQKITVKGLMLHSVGCAQPKATAFTSYWNQPSMNVCVHAFIDANDGTVYQTLPWNLKAWHAGGSANGTHIGVEMCEPDCIKYTGGATFTCSDKTKARGMVSRTYNTAVELFAKLCKEYGLDPLADGVIVSHSEGAKRGIAANHVDPEHLWKQLGMSYTMDGFRKAVKAAMGEPAPAPTKKTIYRVQIGAYSVKANADRQLQTVRNAGFKDAFIASIDGMYKIQVGAYEVKTNAENMLAKVKAAGFSAFIATVTM